MPVDPEGVLGPTPSAARWGGWRRTSTGLYVPTSVDSTSPEQRVVEVAARLPPGGAVTGWASLLLHGGNHFDGLGPDMAPLPVQVALPLKRDVRLVPGVVKLRSPLASDEVVTRLGIPLTVPARALFDVMARARHARAAAVHASVACSAGLVGRAEFAAYVGQRRCIAGIVKVRDALQYVDDRVRSPKEAELFQVWILDAELPRPLMNWPVHDAHGTYVGAPDLLCPELGVYGEYDGSDHLDDGVRGIDANRDADFPALGLVGFRATKGDFRARGRLVKRMLQAVTTARASRLPPSFVLGTDPEPVVARELRAMERAAADPLDPWAPAY